MLIYGLIMNFSFEFFSLQNDLSKPLKVEDMDCNNGVCFPVYDQDIKVVYCCGKVSFFIIQSISRILQLFPFFQRVTVV